MEGWSEEVGGGVISILRQSLPKEAIAEPD